MATYYAQLFHEFGNDRALTASEFAALEGAKRVDINHITWTAPNDYLDFSTSAVTGPLAPDMEAPETTFPFIEIYGSGSVGWKTSLYIRVEYESLPLIDGCLVAYEADHEFPLNAEIVGLLQIYDWGSDGSGVEFSRESVNLGLTAVRIFLPKSVVPPFWMDHVNTQEIA